MKSNAAGGTGTRFNIEVTEKDIERAKRNDSYTCVVAQAIARKLPDSHHIEVDSQAIRFTLNDIRRVYLTPYAVQGYVVAFDAGDPIQPFSFQLRNPVRTKRRRLTEAGRAVHRAATKARRRVHRAAHAAGQPLTPQVIEDAREAQKAAYHEAARVHDEPLTKKETEGRPSIPRVFKRKARTYGSRLLRINRESAPFNP